MGSHTCDMIQRRETCIAIGLERYTTIASWMLWDNVLETIDFVLYSAPSQEMRRIECRINSDCSWPMVQEPCCL